MLIVHAGFGWTSEFHFILHGKFKRFLKI